jgi:hypothetical protein
MKPLIVLLFFANTLIFAQPAQFRFATVFNNSVVKPDSILEREHETRINNFRLYISSIELMKNGKRVFKEKNSFHLIQPFDSLKNSFNIKFKGKFDEVRFYLGIDSLTNISGALGGDLDPMLGMYWTWQSGYINFKLEGTSMLSPARLGEFQFHLGGYSAPHNSLQQIMLPVKSVALINIYFNLQKFLSAIDLASIHHIMSPSAESVNISKLAAACFYTSKE